MEEISQFLLAVDAANGTTYIGVWDSSMPDPVGSQLREYCVVATASLCDSREESVGVARQSFRDLALGKWNMINGWSKTIESTLDLSQMPRVVHELAVVE